jgi:GNAT superfamily N-acetyltransferase
VTEEYPKTVVLTDGAHLVLRPAAAADAAALAYFWSRLPPEERGVPAERDDTLAVLALDGARVAGVATLTPDAVAGERRLAIALDPDHRGRRLGTWMLLDVVHLAAARGVERLVAAPRADDEAFRGALRRLDFVEAAGAGSATVLVKTLHVGWTDF